MGSLADEYGNVFKGTYFNPGQYALNAQFNHVESGCLVRTEDDVTQNINITVVEGPSSDNLTFIF